jgi:hypothetical protein
MARNLTHNFEDPDIGHPFAANLPLNHVATGNGIVH